MKTKLTPQQKRDAGMALNVSELAAVTGYSRSVLKDMKTAGDFALIRGKIRESDFWKQIRVHSCPRG